MLRGLLLSVGLMLGGLLPGTPLGADTVRVGFLTAELDRDGPGLLLRDIAEGEDPQVAAVVAVVAEARADILVLARVDHDLQGLALAALADRIAAAGLDYPHRLGLRPNSGRASDLDLDGDGRLRGPGDAQGWGRFAGQNGMAVLSRWPVDGAGLRDFSDLLWRDLPGATLPRHADGSPFPSAEAQAVQRLATTGFWDVPVALPGGTVLHLLPFHATPPVFDGPEDRNGLRNRDELRFWPLLLDGALPWPAPPAPFVLLGNSNVDADRGEGHRDAMAALLAHPALQDPRPLSPGGTTAGHPAATALWEGEDQPGALRLSVVLPSADLRVIAAGVLWPDADDPAGPAVAAAGHHRLVWVDLDLPAPRGVP